MLLSFTVKPCGQSTPAKGVKDTRGRSIFQEMLHNNDIHHYFKNSTTSQASPTHLDNNNSLPVFSVKETLAAHE